MLGKLCDAEQLKDFWKEDRIEDREEERVEQQKLGRPVFAAQDFDQPLDEFVRFLDGLFDGFCVGCFLHRGFSAEVRLDKKCAANRKLEGEGVQAKSAKQSPTFGLYFARP
jgi:hypothetical protein